MNDDNSKKVPRRAMLKSLGAIAALSPLVACNNEVMTGDAGMDSSVLLDGDVDATVVDGSADVSADIGSDVFGDAMTQQPCMLSPRQQEGPFYFDVEQVRKDITEGKPGKKMRMEVVVLDATNLNACVPISDAVVDLWHADAVGWYSGYPGQGDTRDVDTTGETFCRGLQVTDANGSATFDTMFPGWYGGRTPHMHFKVHLDNTTYVTSQLYWPDAAVDPIYTEAPYRERGPRDTSNADEGLPSDSPLIATLTIEGDVVVSRLIVGIDLS